jgi:hypothetical protein
MLFCLRGAAVWDLRHAPYSDAKPQTGPGVGKIGRLPQRGILVVSLPQNAIFRFCWGSARPRVRPRLLPTAILLPCVTRALLISATSRPCPTLLMAAFTRPSLMRNTFFGCAVFPIWPTPTQRAATRPRLRGQLRGDFTMRQQRPTMLLTTSRRALPVRPPLSTTQRGIARNYFPNHRTTKWTVLAPNDTAFSFHASRLTAPHRPGSAAMKGAGTVPSTTCANVSHAPGASG